MPKEYADSGNPSEVTDAYWIFALYQGKIKRAVRKSVGSGCYLCLQRKLTKPGELYGKP